MIGIVLEHPVADVLKAIFTLEDTLHEEGVTTEFSVAVAYGAK